MPRSTRSHQTTPEMYQRLSEMNAGFEHIRLALTALGSSQLFAGREIRRFSAMADEARAAITSYVLNALENAETDEAARLERARHERERRDESSAGR